jgi:hypothetical protein
MNISFCKAVTGAPRKALCPVHRRIWHRLTLHSLPGLTMEFTLLFLAIAIVMVVAWRGSRTLAMSLFAGVWIACVATYLHHATDVLKLSF